MSLRGDIERVMANTAQGAGVRREARRGAASARAVRARATAAPAAAARPACRPAPARRASAARPHLSTPQTTHWFPYFENTILYFIIQSDRLKTILLIIKLKGSKFYRKYF